MFPGKKNFLIESYEDDCKIPYHPLVLNLKPNTPQHRGEFVGECWIPKVRMYIFQMIINILSILTLNQIDNNSHTINMALLRKHSHLLRTLSKSKPAPTREIIDKSDKELLLKLLLIL